MFANLRSRNVSIDDAVPTGAPTKRDRGEPAAAGWPGLVARWIRRRRQRRHLATLEDRLLQDIGITAEQARREIAKPFWR